MIPTEIARSRHSVTAYTEELEHCVRNDYTEAEFISRLKGENIPVDSEDLHKALYRQLVKLKKQNQNDIWARIIKNSFAPLFTERVDFVIGNPPWIRWENLPEDYRESSKHLWEKYRLFTQTGWKAKVAAGKVDMAVLFVYTGIDSYLKNRGKLGFVITQTLFKSEGGGEGFRKFSIGPNEPFAVFHVDDLSSLQVFEGATNRTATACFEKGIPTEYPVKYLSWNSGQSKRIPQETAYSEILRRMEWTEARAEPSVSGDLRSPWLTLSAQLPANISKVAGKSPFQGREGVNTGGSNGVFWIKPITKTNGNVLISNAGGIGKIKVQEKTVTIESDLVFPLLRGRDVTRWEATPSFHILVTHDKRSPKHPISLVEMKQRYPKTHDFLNLFKIFLSKRPEYLRWGGVAPFYQLYRIGPYTYAPYKIVWRGQVAVKFGVAVISEHEGKLIIPDQTVYLIPFENSDEAHYAAALLNSCVVRAYYQSVAYKHASMDFVKRIQIPKFDGKSKEHRLLTDLSKEAHTLKAGRKDKDLVKVEMQIDKVACGLWGITPNELDQIQKFYKEG